MAFTRLIGVIPSATFGRMIPALTLAAALAATPALCAPQQPLPPINAPGQIGPKPPIGSGGCSVTAPTCAEVAPVIVHSALGPSSLAGNLRLLTAMFSGRNNNPAFDKRVAQWAVRAFHKAGVDEVHVENYALPMPSRLASHNRHGGPWQTGNVVAEIRGRAQENGFVILGASLDARDSATTPLDSACNIAVMIDAARAIHAAGTRPLRSIRFVLFGGGNPGMTDSRAYARAHRSEMDHADAVIIYNAGNGSVTGYNLDGRKSLEDPLREALAPAAQFDADHDTYAPEMESLGFNFLLEGVPTLVANSSGGSRNRRPVDLATLRRNVVLAALTAYGIGDLPERLGTRLTRREVEQLLDRTGIENEMKIAGVWSQWEQEQDGHGR